MNIKLTFANVYDLHTFVNLFARCQKNLFNEIDFIDFYNCESIKHKITNKYLNSVRNVTLTKKTFVLLNINEFITLRDILRANKLESTPDNIILITFANELIEQGTKQIEHFENVYKSRQT